LGESAGRRAGRIDYTFSMTRYLIRNVPDSLLSRMKTLDRDEVDRILLDALTRYLDGLTERQLFAAAGGKARASRLTKAQRSEAARLAVKARWARVRARKEKPRW
jgi:hypothetical protein